MFKLTFHIRQHILLRQQVYQSLLEAVLKAVHILFSCAELSDVMLPHPPDTVAKIYIDGL